MENLKTTLQQTNLTDDEKKIIELKYKAKRISEMNDKEIKAWSKALVLKIHVITGWTIPNSDELLNILIDQFEKKLIENYGELNHEEIEYAFRSQGTTVEDWGKAMNLNLLDKVLIPYLNNRFKISEVERQITYRKNKPEFSLDNDIDYRRMIEEDYQFFLGGKILITFPIHYYKTLVDDNFIPAYYFEKHSGTESDAKDKSVLDVFNHAKDNGFKNLYLKS